ncbi:Tkl protein kinase, partial [Globisporangium splendens]
MRLPVLRLMRVLPALFLTIASVAQGVRMANVTYCSDTSHVALTTCNTGAVPCGADQPCVQYPSSAATKCSEASRNDCQAHDATCTFQCLGTYNMVSAKWTLFVKDPKTTDVAVVGSTDPFPSAPVDKITSAAFSDETKTIQITGFDSTNVQKGSVKKVTFDADAFSAVAVLETLVVTNVDMSTASSGLLPQSVSALYLENCNLNAFPQGIATMRNLAELYVVMNVYLLLMWRDIHFTKNVIAEMPANDSTVATALQKVKLFISSLQLTQEQYTMLKRLSAGALGISSVSGSCASGATEGKVLDSVVCVSASADGGTTTKGKKGSSSSVIIIVCIVAGVVLVAGIGFFVYRRHKARSKDNYFATMSYNNNTGQSGPRTNPNSRPSGFGSMGQRPSTLQNNNERGGASSGFPGPSFSTGGNTTTGLYSEIGRYQEEISRGTAASTQDTMRNIRDAPLRIQKNVLRIDASEINYTRSIAKGAFGEVWLAHHGGDLVAVKKLLTVDPASVSDFVAELNLLATLSHPRILKLIGACYDEMLSDIQIVTEYMDSGDLLTVLRKHSPTELTWENGKGAFCMQICEAIYYLHTLPTPLIHRDIKSRNILMDSRKGAKLSDFGESRERTFQQTMTAGVGTARWVAPEIILGEDYSELADIYSLGVLLTELDTHMIPYQNMGLEESTIVQQVAVGKLRPKVSDSCPEVIRRLTHECLQFDPQMRPPAARVLQTLQSSAIGRRPTTILEAE